MTIAFADNVIVDRLQAMSRALDAGTAGGKIKIYSGSRPGVKGGPITSQVLLVINRFIKPSSAGVSAGILSFDVDETPAVCLASGLATWARLTDSNDVFVADCDVGATGSGADVEISRVQLYEGGEVSPVVGSLAEI